MKLWYLHNLGFIIFYWSFIRLYYIWVLLFCVLISSCYTLNLFFIFLAVSLKIILIRFWWLQNKIKVINNSNQVKFFKFNFKNIKKIQVTMEENQYRENLMLLKTWSDLGQFIRWHLLVHLGLNYFLCA